MAVVAIYLMHGLIAGLTIPFAVLMGKDLASFFHALNSPVGWVVIFALPAFFILLALAIASCCLPTSCVFCLTLILRHKHIMLNAGGNCIWVALHVIGCLAVASIFMAMIWPIVSQNEIPYLREMYVNAPSISHYALLSISSIASVSCVSRLLKFVDQR